MDILYGVLDLNLLNFETGSQQELKLVYELIAGITPEQELINLLRLRYDFHNLTRKIRVLSWVNRHLVENYKFISFLFLSPRANKVLLDVGS